MQKKLVSTIRPIVEKWILLIWILIAVPVVQVAVDIVYAGDPDSSGDPLSVVNYTLEDLYNRLSDGLVGSPRAFTEPADGPGTGTMVTLNELMNAAPGPDDENGADAGQVTAGTTYWSLRSGEWGEAVGTMPDIGAVEITPGTADQPIPAGYHNGEGVVTGDGDLQPENIAAGTEIFGVDGEAIYASGDAPEQEVLIGRDFSNDAGPATGTMPDNGAVEIMPGPADRVIAAGYHNGEGLVIGDDDLQPWNIASGVELFGVTGERDFGSVIPKTGQTESQAAGDDGDLQKGVRWPHPRFTDNGDGTVTDNLTRLIWLQNADCAGHGIGWVAGMGYIDEMNAEGTMDGNDCGDHSDYGNHRTDWRMPNINELRTLFSAGIYNPAVPDADGYGQWSEGDPFFGAPPQNVTTYFYWSSTVTAVSPSQIWTVNVYTGDSYIEFKQTLSGYTFRVWPVRDDIFELPPA